MTKGTQEKEEEGGSGIAGPSFALDYSMAMSIRQRSLGAVGDTEGNEAGDTPRGVDDKSLSLSLVSVGM